MQLLYTKVYKRKGTCNTFCIHDEINMVPCAKRWRSNMATCTRTRLVVTGGGGAELSGTMIGIKGSAAPKVALC